MTIQIDHRELQALIEQRLQSGAFQNVEELLLQALQPSEPEGNPAPTSEAENLLELFAHSPFSGLNMNFERDTDTGREIEL